MGKMLLFLVLMFFASPLYAMNEAEYQRLVKSWPAFAKANEDLNETWKVYTSGLKKADKSFILKSQRQWIKTGRDEEARELMDEGHSKGCAYLIATLQRIGFLKVFSYNANLSQEDQDAGRLRADGYYDDEMEIPEECARN